MPIGMKPRIQLRIGGLNPQKVAVCASHTPSAVCLIRLFAQAERNTKPFTASFMDSCKHILDKDGILFAFDLARLKNDVTISGITRHFRTSHNLIGIQQVALDLMVIFPYSAIETVLRADVPALYKATQGDNTPNLAALDLVRSSEQLLRIGPLQKTNNLLARKRT
jgi:hypothetical protein